MLTYALNNNPEIFEQVSQRFTTFEVGLSLVSMALVFVAMVLLFFLRSLSFWILLVVTLASLIPLGIRLISGHEAPLSGTQNHGVKIIEFIIWGSILIYTWRLKLKGVLK